MGIKLKRQKPRNFLLSFFYRLDRLIPLSSRKKIRLYLNLEWIFDRLAHEASFKVYAPHEHPIRTKSASFILQQIRPGSIVLDLGCDLGDIAYIIAGKAKEVVGIDYSERAINIAKQRYNRPNLSFVHGEALEYLGSNQKKFDTLILSHILEHLDEPEQFLRKFKDFFEQIYIELPDFDRHYLNQYRLDLGLELVYSDNDHVSEFDRYELNTMLEKCNIEVIRSEYMYGVQKLWCKVLK
jgi:SAM-dependent methyltransferase